MPVPNTLYCPGSACALEVRNHTVCPGWTWWPTDPVLSFCFGKKGMQPEFSPLCFICTEIEISSLHTWLPFIMAPPDGTLLGWLKPVPQKSPHSCWKEPTEDCQHSASARAAIGWREQPGLHYLGQPVNTEIKVWLLAVIWSQRKRLPSCGVPTGSAEVFDSWLTSILPSPWLGCPSTPLPGCPSSPLPEHPSTPLPDHPSVPLLSCPSTLLPGSISIHLPCSPSTLLPIPSPTATVHPRDPSQ